MNVRSIRLRLTFWNMAVLALVLAAFGGGLRYRVQVNLRNTEDRRLENRVDTLLRWWYILTPEQRRNLVGSLPGNAHPLLRVILPQAPLLDGSRTLRTPLDSRDAGGRILYKALDSGGHAFLTHAPDTPWDPPGFRAALRGNRAWDTIRIDGVDARVLSVPVKEEGQVRGVIQAARAVDDIERQVDTLTRALLTLIPLSLLAVGISGAFLTSRALRPVRRITRAAEEMSAADLSRRLDVPGDDEFTRLAKAFNALFARLEEAFEQQRRFTQDASHELRTPLAGIKASTSLSLSGEWTADEYRAAIVRIDAAASRMQRLVQDLLLAGSDARQMRLDPRLVSVADVLADAIRALPECPEYPAVVLNAPEPNLMVLGDAHHLERLFVNLLENALRHTPKPGRITLAARADGEQVAVTVADTGCGIPPEHLPHVTERFYRVDTARARRHGGSGLGLAICRSIAEAHGGALRIDSRVGKGTTVTVTLPLAREPLPDGDPRS